MIVRVAGLAASATYASFVIWLYVSQPQTVAQVTGGVAAGIGAYAVDPQATADAMGFFRRDAFPEARAAFLRADPAIRDANTQFYIAYTLPTGRDGAGSMTTIGCSARDSKQWIARLRSRRTTGSSSTIRISACDRVTN